MYIFKFVNKYLRKSVSFILFLMCASTSYASNGDFAFNNKLFTYKGVTINTDFDITPENFRAEGGVLADVTKNNYNDIEIVEIISTNGEMEVWGYSQSFSNKLMKICKYPIEYNVNWVSPMHLEFSRMEMGFSNTIIYKFDSSFSSIRISKFIENMIYFEVESEYFVTFTPSLISKKGDIITIGKIFTDYQDFFNIDIKYEYLSDALDLMKGAEIEGNVVKVKVKQGDKIVIFQHELSGVQ